MEGELRENFRRLEQQMRENIDILNESIPLMLRSQENAVQHRNALRTRLVWFVAISGYVLVNAESLWNSVLRREIEGLEMLWFSLPWIMCSFFSAIAYYFADELYRRIDDQLIIRTTDLKVQLMQLSANVSKWQDYMNDIPKFLEDRGIEQVQEDAKKVNDLLGVISGTSEEYASKQKVIVRIKSLISFFDRLAFIFLVLGFIWMVVGPLILNRCML